MISKWGSWPHGGVFQLYLGEGHKDLDTKILESGTVTTILEWGGALTLYHILEHNGIDFCIDMEELWSHSDGYVDRHFSNVSEEVCSSPTWRCQALNLGLRQSNMLTAA